MFGNNQGNFKYTGSPGEKILQKVLGGATFLTHTVHTYIHNHLYSAEIVERI